MYSLISKRSLDHIFKAFFLKHTLLCEQKNISVLVKLNFTGLKPVCNKSYGKIKKNVMFKI